MAYPCRLLLLLIALACFVRAYGSPGAFSEEEKASAAELLIGSEPIVSSLEEKYELLRSFQVLGISREGIISCEETAKVLTSSSFSLKDLFYASKIGEVQPCKFKETELKETAINLLLSLRNSDALLDLRFGIGALAKLKTWIKDDFVLENGIDIFHKIKALGQDDGTWKYDSTDDEASGKAAGLALEALADFMAVASSTLDDAKIRFIRGAASKLFESIQKYEDGTLFFGERSVDAVSGGGGPLAATSCIVKGVTAIASAIPGKLEILPEKIAGLANFFLSAGIPGSYVDMFYVLDALDALDKNSFIVPLVVSVHPSVLSLTAKNTLKVMTTTVLGSPIPAAVTLRKLVRATEKDAILSNQALESDDNSIIHQLNLFNYKVDIGVYDLTFKVKPLEGGKFAIDTQVPRRILVTGVASISEVEVGVLDSDTGTAEVTKRWDRATQEVISLFATHRQKLHILLDVLSPLKQSFKPHQVFMKLRHQSKVEHLFLLKPDGKKLALTLDLLGLVQRLNYVSGAYTMEIIVGDAAMENPAMWTLGIVELDLPEPPEGVARPSAVTQTMSKYGPKPEITHIFRPADKRAPPMLSNSFLALTLVPLLGFLVGLKLLNTNMKGIPTSGLPLLSALLFHVGLASILGLYVLFWLKLNLFQTLKLLGLLASVLTVPGYYLLSHLADSSGPKVKSA